MSAKRKGQSVSYHRRELAERFGGEFGKNKSAGWFHIFSPFITFASLAFYIY